MDIEREIARMLGKVKPTRIVLFGSRAKGCADERSDVDLIVVYRTDKRFLDRLEELYLLWDIPVAVDILAYTPEEFDRMMIESAFVRDAVTGGREILEAP